MAKVKIQGHASGTGVLTVTAPNTSTDRTITLPDSTGTLATTTDVPSSITDNGDATAITIDSSENVGIGHPLNTHTQKLVVKKNFSATTPSSGAIVNLVNEQGAGNFASLRFTGTNQNAYLGYRDGTTSTDRRLSIGVGADSEHFSFTSNGLTFNGDTAAANALDDYEEGNWTPTLTGSGTISHRVGKYVKIGNQIMVQGEIRSTSYNNSGATDVQIGGLPYSSYNESNYNFAANITPVSGFNLSSDHGIVGYVSPNQTHINLYGLNQGAGPNYDFLQQGEMGTTVEVFFAVHYRTN